MSSVGRHLTFANVVSVVALFVALGGGAYAVSTAPRDSVVSKSIKDGAVTYPKLACKGNSAKDKMVRAGAVCIDRYEASVWSQPKGGTQYGVSSDDYPCDDNGQDCDNIYARSVRGVTPSSYITWFQAQQALANSGKRLPSSAEWQQAVAGTPDSADCNENSGAVQNTGVNAGCISRFGANDMVGNLWEWVADWVPRSTTCGSWPPGYGNSFQCVAGAATAGAPGALIRGGAYGSEGGGPFAVYGLLDPTSATGVNGTGFRGAR